MQIVCAVAGPSRQLAEQTDDYANSARNQSHYLYGTLQAELLTSNHNPNNP